MAFVCIVALGAATRALWSGDAASRLTSDLGYGLSALAEGRWWTVVTGAVFAVSPLGYVPVLLGLLVVGGFAERRLGTARTVAAAAVCHVVGVVGAAAVLALLRIHGCEWAAALSGRTDAGPSAAFLGAGAAATAGVALSWRARLRVALVGYVALSLLYVGGVADVEHALAVAAGLLLGPVLLGRRPGLTPRLTRRDHRRLAAWFLVVSGLAAAVSSVRPVSGPLTGPATDARLAAVSAGHGLPGGVALHTIVFLVLARAVARGTRRSWWVATSVVAGVGVAQLVAVSAFVARDRSCWPVMVDNAALNIAGLVILLLAKRSCANPSRRRSAHHRESLYWPGDESERAEATACLGRIGSVSRLAWMTTWPDNRWFFGRARPGFVAHRIHAGVALGVGDPVGSATDGLAGLVAEFALRARTDGLAPCLFGVTDQTRDAAVRVLGWRAVQVAEEAIIDLDALELRGKAWQDVRTALNQAGKRGIEVQIGALATLPARVQQQVEEISDLWVRDKGLPELGLTLGGVEEARDPKVRVAVAVDMEGRVHGVTSWMPIHRVGDGRPVGWTLDVMRRRPDGFRGVMELLIVKALLAFRAEGAELVSLSAAPLARVSGRAANGAVAGFLDRLGAELEPLYGFRSLQAFKAKFQPRYEPLYLVFPDEAALPRIAVALTRAYLPGAGLRQLAGILQRRSATRTVAGVSPTAHSVRPRVAHRPV